MARPIGDYRHVFAVLRRAVTKDSVYGQNEPAWTESFRARGSCEELGAHRDDQGNRKRTVADAVITLRGRLAVYGVDRLQKVGTSEIYRIEGVHKTDTETVCTCFRVTEANGETET